MNNQNIFPTPTGYNPDALVGPKGPKIGPLAEASEAHTAAFPSRSETSHHAISTRTMTRSSGPG